MSELGRRDPRNLQSLSCWGSITCWTVSIERKDRIKEVNFYFYVVNFLSKYLSWSWRKVNKIFRKRNPLINYVFFRNKEHVIMKMIVHWAIFPPSVLESIKPDYLVRLDFRRSLVSTFHFISLACGPMGKMKQQGLEFSKLYR